jgi:hypothetical protein
LQPNENLTHVYSYMNLLTRNSPYYYLLKYLLFLLKHPVYIYTIYKAWENANFLNAHIGRDSTTTVARACSRPVGAPIKLILWRPFEPIFFQLFRLQKRAGEHFLGHVPKLRTTLGESLPRVENLCLLATYFRWLHRHLSAPCWLSPQADARLSRPLDRPWAQCFIGLMTVAPPSVTLKISAFFRAVCCVLWMMFAVWTTTQITHVTA